MAKLIKVLSTILIILLVIMIPVNIVVRMFDNTISLLVAGNTFWELENEDESAVYFKGDYASQAERLAAGTALCYQVEAEGAALLLNNGALPLAAGAKVSTLSVNSVNLTYGGTGSGNVDASKADNLKVALRSPASRLTLLFGIGTAARKLLSLWMRYPTARAQARALCLQVRLLFLR